MRYACIEHRRTQFPVRMMCQGLKVSRSGYYGSRRQPRPTARESRAAELVEQTERSTTRAGASTGLPVFTRSFIDEEFLGVATESRNS